MVEFNFFFLNYKRIEDCYGLNISAQTSVATGNSLIYFVYILNVQNNFTETPQHLPGDVVNDACPTPYTLSASFLQKTGTSCRHQFV